MDIENISTATYDELNEFYKKQSLEEVDNIKTYKIICAKVLKNIGATNLDIAITLGISYSTASKYLKY